jgi:O-antigen/teichoic acid export membrane protein
MVVWRHFWPRPCVDLRLWRALLRDGVPLGTAAILRKMSGRVDVLILAVLGTHGAAGHFAASYKVIEAFGIVATTLTQVLFPLLSRSARSEAMFQGVVAIGVRYLFALGLPVAIVLAASAERIVTLVYGPSFAPASTALAVMSLSCATVFVTSLYPFIFAALHAQRPYIAAATAGLLVNVLVDVALVPGFGHVGASLGTVSAEVTFLALGALFLKRRMPTLAIARLSWRPLAAALPMAGVVLLASRYSDGTFAAGLAGATAVYVVLLIVLGAIRPGELATIRRELGYRSRRPTPPGVSTDVRERSSHRPGLDPDSHPAIVGPPAPLAASDLRLRETV